MATLGRTCPRACWSLSILANTDPAPTLVKRLIKVPRNATPGVSYSRIRNYKGDVSQSDTCVSVFSPPSTNARPTKEMKPYPPYPRPWFSTSMNTLSTPYQISRHPSLPSNQTLSKQQNLLRAVREPHFRSCICRPSPTLRHDIILPTPGATSPSTNDTKHLSCLFFLPSRRARRGRRPC